MGELLLAAKITHVPTMLLSERPGRLEGKRQQAIDGHKEIGRRMRALGVDTVVVIDTHWLVNAGFHVNANAHFKGVYTSHEFPHFIQNLAYEYDGNPVLGDLIAEKATAKGVMTLSHQVETLDLEYGTLVPMRYMNQASDLKVVSVAGWCSVHNLMDEVSQLWCVHGQHLLRRVEHCLLALLCDLKTLCPVSLRLLVQHALFTLPD